MMKIPKILQDFNITALPSKAVDLAFKGANFLWEEQHRFQQNVNLDDAIASGMSKAQYVRGRMADNMFRKIARGDIESRPIAFAAMNLAESVGPIIMRAAMKASANPVAVGSVIAVAALVMDETTRSMMTEQVSNLASLFSSQVHDMEDQLNVKDTQPSIPSEKRMP